MAHIVDTYSVCTDCHLFLANGEFPPNNTSEQDWTIVSGVDRIQTNVKDGTLRGHLLNGSEENGREFSRYECECCRSKFGGARHEAILMSA